MRATWARFESPRLCGAPGAIVGLFLARVALEIPPRSWSGGLVVVVGLLAACGGLFLGQRLAKRGIRLWPALPLLVYVLWPRRDPATAASVAALSALIWSLSREPSPGSRWAEPLADGATFVVALIVYVATVAPDVLPADAGEFQLAAALLGVAHPPGFPLYTMVGHLFIRLIPWGTPAYRLNLMSGLLAAGTLVLMARATRLWSRRLGASTHVAIAGGLAAALTLGSSTTFWAQATIANVRTPAVLLAALALYILARFATATEPRQADRDLVCLGITLGLAGGHYPPLAFVGIFFAIYVWLSDPRLAAQPRRWWKPLLAGLAAFGLPLTYLPMRGAMGAPLAPEGLDTLSGFLHHFLALGFRGDMFAFATAADLPHRLSLLPTLFSFQFNLPLLAAALLGLLGLLWRDRRLFVLLAGSLALHTFVSITYRAPQTVEYLMPAYLPIAIAVGLLPSLLPRARTPTILCCSLVLWAGLLNGWAHGPSFVELAQDRTARQAVRPLLETAPAGSLILADWHWATPLWYLQQVEGFRSDDVEVRYVYPVAGEEYRDVWLRRIQEADPERPVLLTHFYQFDGYTTEPWETGFVIRPRPVTQPAAPLSPAAATFGGTVRLLGRSLRQGQLYPGQAAELVLVWQPTGPLEFQPSFTLRLVDAEGRDRAQVDRSLPTGVAPGEVCFERLTLPLYPALPPGRYRVTLGAYTVSDAGFETLPTAQGETVVTLTELELAPLSRPPFTLHRQIVPFDGGPTLVGVDYDRSVPGVLRVYLHWRGSGASPLQAWVRTSDGTESTASLPPIPRDAYQTIVVDISLPNSQPPSSLALFLSDGQGQRQTAASAWGWPTQEVRLPTASLDAQFVPLGDEMAVVGASARPAAPGEPMAIDVELAALRPLTTDDSTSVRMMGADGRWLATHDYQPALGAVPTLKWIRGSRVVDRHLLQVPEDFAGEDVRATLLVYERFRMTPLPSMDGRFSEVPLGRWTLP